MLRFADLEQDVMLLDWARELHTAYALSSFLRWLYRHVSRWLGGKGRIFKGLEMPKPAFEDVKELRFAGIYVIFALAICD